MKVSILAIFITFLFLACRFEKYPEGERLYQTYCQNCHQEDGKGLGKLIPPLVSADYYHENISKLPCIIKNGLSDTIIVNGIVFTDPMPANTNLTAIQITNLINYLNNRWYKDLPNTSLSEVKQYLESCN